MQRVIIADVRSHAADGVVRGHGYAVAANYLEIFRGATEIRVAGGPAYCRRFGETTIALPYDTENSRPMWLNKLRIMLNMRHLFRLCRNDTIVIQSSGVVTALMGIALFKRQQTRLFMILYNETTVSSRLKRFIFRLAKGKIAGILCPNDKVGKAHGLSYCKVPDYIYCGEPTAPPVAYADKLYDFCMVGQIWRNKGMVEVARHLAGKQYKVLIAGAISEEEGLEEDLRAACRGADNIDLRIGYLSAEEYDKVIRDSRYCILNYSGAYSQQSSGVVFDILFRGVPVIGRYCQTLRFVNEFQVGYTYSDISKFDPQSVMNESAYLEYCRHLTDYYAAHLLYREQVQRFVMS